MNKYIFTSLNKDAGKTGIIVGLSKLVKGKIGYLKPFGDRLVYKDKRLWDYDSVLIANLLDLKQNPEELSIGFDHSKLQYLYDEDSMAEKLDGMISKISSETDILFIETGANLIQGVSVHLDALTIAKNTEAKLIIVASGNNDIVLDSLTYLMHNVRLEGIDLAGIVINKVKDIETIVGRTKSSRWGAREIDLDIILYESIIYKDALIEIPHKEYSKRDFVLVPLNDIAFNLIDPVTEKSIKEMIENLDEKFILKKIENNLNEKVGDEIV